MIFAIAAERDALVPRASAFGEHPEAAHALRFPPDHCVVAAGLGHLDMLGYRSVWYRV